MNLTPLRELEPTAEEISRVRARAAAECPGRRRAAPRRAPLAFAAVAVATAVALALPGSQSATSALRAAAAAAADQPGPADFTGYRYVDMIDRRTSPWVILEEGCEPRPATLDAKADPAPCRETARVTYTGEGRVELWVDANWKGTRRDHGSAITRVTGDPELAEAVRRELARKPSTIPYVYGEGPFARAPLPELPTESGPLRDVLSSAYADGRWRTGGRLATTDRAMLDYELARFTTHLLAEANATPALRAAAFGMLASMDGVVDLGEVEDSRGRSGHGIEIHGRAGVVTKSVPATLTVVFDPGRGDVLSWSERMPEQSVEWVLLRTEHVSSRP